MEQGALGAADIRRVGYGLEVSRSGRGGTGVLCRHAHSLLMVQLWIRLIDYLLLMTYSFRSASAFWHNGAIVDTVNRLLSAYDLQF